MLRMACLRGKTKLSSMEILSPVRATIFESVLGLPYVPNKPSWMSMAEARRTLMIVLALKHQRVVRVAHEMREQAVNSNYGVFDDIDIVEVVDELELDVEAFRKMLLEGIEKRATRVVWM